MTFWDVAICEVLTAASVRLHIESCKECRKIYSEIIDHIIFESKKEKEGTKT